MLAARHLQVGRHGRLEIGWDVAEDRDEVVVAALRQLHDCLHIRCVVHLRTSTGCVLRKYVRPIASRASASVRRHSSRALAVPWRRISSTRPFF